MKRKIRKNNEGWLEWLGWPLDADSVRKVQSINGLPDYSVYHLSRRQFILAAAVGWALMFAAAYLFYRSVIVALILSLAGLIAPRINRKSLLVRRRVRLTLQFKEALYSVTSSLAAGRSVENAFVTALDDLKLLYPDPDTEVLVEFEIIRTRMAYGEPLEHALEDLSQRAGIDDIAQFVDVFATCKRSGGDLVEVIRRTSQTIGEKLDIQQDITVMLAQKRYESRIMMAVPFVFLAFLGFSAPDYMEPLYGGIGYVLLTVSLLLLLLCYWIMTKIMDIRM
ncbi:type II secretion system F family protein [Paenibacillus sepulcri]|uniref:Type II secretion system F family protein n=1 Tax=Paenibacillus sepulcri TaxID=359917 RepID=A0ABS7BZJ4_9BACL|nr:type II secretion system F family protein [Paenibacillus sepulcri]